MGKVGSKGLCEPSKLPGGGGERSFTIESSIADHLYYDIYNKKSSKALEKYLEWEILGSDMVYSNKRVVFFSHHKNRNDYQYEKFIVSNTQTNELAFCKHANFSQNVDVNIYEKMHFMNEIANIGPETRSFLSMSPQSNLAGYISLANLQVKKSNDMQMVGIVDFETFI